MNQNTGDTLALLSSHNLVRIPVPGDGNCLFHSLALFFQDSSVNHLSMRQRLCTYIAQHRADFEPVVADTRHSLDDYLNYMSRPGAYGDGIMVDAFSLCFQINVFIFNQGRSYQTLPDAAINIALYWDKAAQHYEPAFPTSSPRIARH